MPGAPVWVGRRKGMSVYTLKEIYKDKDFPAGSVAKTLLLMQGTSVQSLVIEGLVRGLDPTCYN